MKRFSINKLAIVGGLVIAILLALSFLPRYNCHYGWAGMHCHTWWESPHDH